MRTKRLRGRRWKRCHILKYYKLYLRKVFNISLALPGSIPISDSGQLGRDGATNAFLPVTSGSLSNAKAIEVALGRYHTVVLTDKGKVVTFGLNDVGQLGRPGSVSPNHNSNKAQSGGVKSEQCTCDSGGNCKCLDNGRGGRDGESCIGGYACRDGVAGVVTALETKAPVKFIAAGI